MYVGITIQLAIISDNSSAVKPYTDIVRRSGITYLCVMVLCVHYICVLKCIMLL